MLEMACGIGDVLETSVEAEKKSLEAFGALGVNGFISTDLQSSFLKHREGWLSHGLAETRIHRARQ